MSLIIVILILIVWGIYSIVQASKPSLPPGTDTKQLLKDLQQLDTQKERRKYLNQLAREGQKKAKQNRR